MNIENPEIQKLEELLESEDFDPKEKTIMELEHAYREYKFQTRWEDRILKEAEEEVIK